jgi:hypothetical protein
MIYRGDTAATNKAASAICSDIGVEFLSLKAR